MIRNSQRRLGDAAADNISAAVFGSAGYAAASGQGSLVNNVAGQLTAQGINPATATPAQVKAVYNQGQAAILAQLQAGNLNPVLPLPPIPPAAPPTALVSRPGPAPSSNVVTYIPPAPIPPAVMMPTSQSALATLESLPTWAYVAGAIGLGLVLFGGHRR